MWTVSNSFSNALECRWLFTWHQYHQAIKKWTSTLAQDWLFWRKCHGKCLQEKFWAARFQDFKGGGMPPDPLRGLCLWCLNLASSCSGCSPAFGSNNFSLKAKHHWNTRKLCILTDAFKGSFPPCRSGTVASVLDAKPRPKELLFFGTWLVEELHGVLIHLSCSYRVFTSISKLKFVPTTPEHYRRCSNDFRRLPNIALQSARTNQMVEYLALFSNSC